MKIMKTSNLKDYTCCYHGWNLFPLVAAKIKWRKYTRIKKAKTSSASVDRFFTGVLTASIDYVRWNTTGCLSLNNHPWGIIPGYGLDKRGKAYEIAIGPVGNRWKNYYTGVLSSFGNS
jgi:hypothetical protein